MLSKFRKYEKNILMNISPYIGQDTLLYNSKYKIDTEFLFENISKYFEFRCYRVMAKIIINSVTNFHNKCLIHSCIEALEYYRCRNYPLISVDEALPFLLSNSRMLKYIQRCGVCIENAYILRGKLWYKRKPDFVGYSYTNW